MITFDDLKNLIVIQTSDLSSAELLSRLLNLFVAVAGVIAFVYLVYAGILYITASSNPDQAKRAQLAFVNVIIGILIISISYILIRTVGSLMIIITR